MSAPKILALANSMRCFPIGPTTKAGRVGSLVRWAKPNSVKRVRTMGNGHKIIPNRGEVLPIHGR